MSSVLGRAATGAMLLRQDPCPARGPCRSSHSLPPAAAGPRRAVSRPRRGCRGPRGRAPATSSASADGGHPHDVDARRRLGRRPRARWPGSKPSRAASARRRSVRCDLAQLAAEADLAAGHQVGGHRLAGLRPRRRPGRPPGRRRARAPDPARHGHVETSLRAERQRRRAVRARPAAWASRPASTPWAERRGSGRLRRHHQRLHLDQQRPLAVEHGGHHRPRDPGRRSARNRALGSGTPARPASPISNRPSSSVDPKRCLTGPQQAQRVVAVALERQHGVDHVLEHPRARRAPPSLVTWPTSDRGHAAGPWPRRPGGGRTPAPGRPTRGRTTRRGRRWSGSSRRPARRASPSRRGRARGAADVSATSHRSGATTPRRSARSAHLRAPTPRPRRRGSVAPPPAMAARAWSSSVTCRCRARRPAA